MPHAQCTWIDRILHPLLHSTPYLLYPSHGSTHSDPQHGAQFGRLAVLSPTNHPVGASIVSTYNSSEDIATTLASPGVDGIQDLGMLASPLFTKKRGKCSSMKELSLYLNSASTSSPFPSSTVKLLAMYSLRRKSSRHPKKFTAVLI